MPRYHEFDLEEGWTIDEFLAERTDEEARRSHTGAQAIRQHVGGVATAAATGFVVIGGITYAVGCAAYRRVMGLKGKWGRDREDAREQVLEDRRYKDTSSGRDQELSRRRNGGAKRQANQIAWEQAFEPLPLGDEDQLDEPINYNEVTIDMDGELHGGAAPEEPVVHNLNMAGAALRTTVFRPDNVGVLPGSRVENSVVRSVALVSKTKSNKRFRQQFEALQNDFFEALCPRVTLSEEGHDVVMSVNATGGGRVGGAAAVFVKSFALGDLAPLITYVDEGPASTLGIADANLRSYNFSLRHDYTWKNTTNCLAYFYYREHHCHVDIDEALGLLQCWNGDLSGKRGYAGEANIAAELPLLAATDVLGAALDSRNPSTWRIAQPVSSVRTNWGQGTKWYCVVLPAGGVFQKSIVWHGTMTKFEYDRAVATAVKWVPGMPALLCKVLGEELYNGETKDETTAETATVANVYEAVNGNLATTSMTTGPVQLFESVVTNCSMRVVPGYKKSVYNIGNRSNATAGLNGIVADLPYDTAKRYSHVNGDGNAIQAYQDIGSYATGMESAANAALGADQGIRTGTDPD